MEMGTVQRPPRIAEVWIELASLPNFGRCAIGGKMDMFRVEWTCETMKDGVDGPSDILERDITPKNLVLADRLTAALESLLEHAGIATRTCHMQKGRQFFVRRDMF